MLNTLVVPGKVLSQKKKKVCKSLCVHERKRNKVGHRTCFTISPSSFGQPSSRFHVYRLISRAQLSKPSGRKGRWLKVCPLFHSARRVCPPTVTALVETWLIEIEHKRFDSNRTSSNHRAEQTCVSIQMNLAKNKSKTRAETLK